LLKGLRVRVVFVVVLLVLLGAGRLASADLPILFEEVLVSLFREPRKLFLLLVPEVEDMVLER
jgi:hypothetical protein